MRTKIATKLIPSVNSKEFKKLHYKEQLQILNLYYHDRSKYQELTGLPDKTVEYVDSAIEEIFSISREPKFTKGIPVSFVTDCWCAYKCYYNVNWWEAGLSPLDKLGYDHQKVFGFNLFNFPIVSMDFTTSKFLKWLVKNPKKTREGHDIFFHMIRMRSAWEFFAESGEEVDPVLAWNLAVEHLLKITSVEDLNGDYPVTEFSDLLDMIDADDLAPVFSQLRGYQGRHFMPLVPAELYNQSQFQVKGWDFLISR